MKKKTILGLVLLLLSIIPIVYSGLFLGASKDPYGNLSKLPVAIVEDNQNSVQEKLVESHLFDFKSEPDMRSAQKALEKGEVYSIISFNNEFQEALTTFPKTGRGASITLTTSEGLNYFASKVITSAMSQFVSTLNADLSSKLIHKLDGNHIPTTIASLVELKILRYHPVKNNAEAMAPYLFSLTLFVGTIYINQFIMRKIKIAKESFLAYWKKQFIYPFIIALVQVLLLIVGNQLFIHVPIDSMSPFIFFLCLVSLTFCSIIIGINQLIPGIGNLLVLLLTMLQTSTAAGVYPISLASNVFLKINAYLPMTYSIEGLRKVISLNGYALSEDVARLFIFVILGQLLIVCSYFIHKKKANQAPKNY